MFPVIDFLAGPDTYRNLPALIGDAEEGKRPAALEFRIEETYAGIDPFREVGVGAFVPVTRGCNNMCAFCVVPFTRGRERSQPFSAVMDEVRRVVEKGYGEITLLGQNVNSYADPEGGETLPPCFVPSAGRLPDAGSALRLLIPKIFLPILLTP